MAVITHATMHEQASYLAPVQLSACMQEGRYQLAGRRQIPEIAKQRRPGAAAAAPTTRLLHADGNQPIVGRHGRPMSPRGG
jgi:hypothetical protein